MRKAKDKRNVPKRYFRPTQTICPRCGHGLKRCYAVGRKYVVFLNGRFYVVSFGYRCPNLKCAGRERVYTSQEVRHLTLRGSSFALEVIAQIGYWRFWKRWTVAQIHAVLTQERRVPISERQVLYVIGVFLVLLRCTYPLRLEEHATYFRRHGLFLSIDALKPEKGNRALYVVRELKFGLVLQVVSLFSTGQSILERRLLQPVKAVGYRIRGVVSDDETALVRAVAHVWPGMPHQTCQLHCLLDAAIPIVASDQAFKKALKKAIRAPFYAVCRALELLPPEDPRAEVLKTYAELIRATLTEGSKPPFALGGLRVFADLTRLEASLERSRQKGGIRCWSVCCRWCNGASPLRRSIGDSAATGTGWCNWIGCLTHPKSKGNRVPPVARSSAKSKPSWRSWNTMPATIPPAPRWWRISVPPCGSVGHVCLRATLGRNATAPTMNWKRSSDVSARANGKFTVASRCMSLSCATASGRSFLIQPSHSNKC